MHQNLLSNNNDAQNTTKYGFLLQPKAQIVALRAHCTRTALKAPPEAVKRQDVGVLYHSQRVLDIIIAHTPRQCLDKREGGEGCLAVLGFFLLCFIHLCKLFGSKFWRLADGEDIKLKRQLG